MQGIQEHNNKNKTSSIYNLQEMHPVVLAYINLFIYCHNATPVGFVHITCV
jgi:hypothetical protein